MHQIGLNAENNQPPLLSVRGLSVHFGAMKTSPALGNISFDVQPREILGIVGESGSGKSVTCRAITGLLPETARVNGNISFEGNQYPLSRPQTLAQLRGSGISMIFQDPMSALDPLMTVRRHLNLRTKDDPCKFLRQAGIANPQDLLDAYAHQLSGGQCQRVAIACALANHPKLLIADEPTTALDVTVQAEILQQLKILSSEHDMAMLFITHDLAVIHQLCNRVLVMNKGAIVEQGPVKTVLTNPRDSYTKALLSAIPRPSMRGKRLTCSSKTIELSQTIPAVDTDQPVLWFDNICVRYKRPDGSYFEAVKRVSAKLKRGEILGLVGESGSGKSTLAKTSVGLVPPTNGQVFLAGEKLDWANPKMEWRRDIQYIFQDPRGALDPSARILSQVRMPLDVHQIGKSLERETRARALMQETRLEETLFSRKPRSLSGGQRQRATIARALVLRPKVLICDESVSALDVSIQARILDLLMDLREKFSISILFISHDLSVIHHLCDRVIVMHDGELVEEAETGTLFNQPQQAYTKKLLSAIPHLPEQGNKNAILAGGML